MSSNVRIINGQVVRGSAPPTYTGPSATTPSVGLGSRLESLIDYLDDKLNTKGKVIYTPNLPSVSICGVHVHGWTSTGIPHVALYFALAVWLVLLSMLPVLRATATVVLVVCLWVHSMSAAKLGAEKGACLAASAVQSS